MKNQKLKKGKGFVLTIVATVVLFGAVLSLMQHVRNLLHSDVRINLTEIVTQNKDVIASKLMLEVNNMGSFADQLAEQFSQAESKNQEALEEVFLSFTADKNINGLAWANAAGNAIFSTGDKIDISGRRYFRLGLEGTANISERTISRLNGDDIFVICVPVTDQGKIIGTVQKQYTPREMYDICSISLFSEQGFMYIINKEGYILISSDQSQFTKESDNLYRILYANDKEKSKALESDIQNSRSGFMETELNGEAVFSAYTPIDAVHDWYLISSINTDAVSPNGTIVIKMFYALLLSVALFFAILMVYFLRLKNRQQAELARLAFEDNITKGSSLTRFVLDLQQLFLQYPQRQFFILTFDIDNFKYINSVYGFDRGDRILKDIYDTYRKKLKSTEFIARRSADHFALLLENADEERLNELFTMEMDLQDIRLTLSAGLYPVTNKTESVNLMLDKANMAAQKIKGMRYKHVERYAEDYDTEMIQNEETKRAVEVALEEGEIIPYFQPKVNIVNRSLTGAEALARWQTKDGKLISPGEFIPVCEKTGLIVAIDMTIFEQTLAFLQKNLQNGIPCVPISVNFSRLHLLNPHFLDDILEKLCAYQVPAHLVELELTETAIYDNYQAMTELIGKLHTHGLHVSMDDFGSGYSSLHMLKDVDIDVLKIDRGFLRDTVNSHKQKAIFGAIVQMAQKLDIQVVVEGVETVENIDLMQEFGCETAQGYYFAKPMDQKAFQVCYEEGKV